MLRENGGEITISIFGKVTFVGDDDIFYDDPAIRKAADDILFDFLGEENPCELEDYTQTMGGI